VNHSGGCKHFFDPRLRCPGVKPISAREHGSPLRQTADGGPQASVQAQAPTAPGPQGTDRPRDPAAARITQMGNRARPCKRRPWRIAGSYSAATRAPSGRPMSVNSATMPARRRRNSSKAGSGSTSLSSM
jgi:hypothetical protein